MRAENWFFFSLSGDSYFGNKTWMMVKKGQFFFLIFILYILTVQCSILFKRHIPNRHKINGWTARGKRKEMNGERLKIILNSIAERWTSEDFTRDGNKTWFFKQSFFFHRKRKQFPSFFILPSQFPRFVTKGTHSSIA